MAHLKTNQEDTDLRQNCFFHHDFFRGVERLTSVGVLIDLMDAYILWFLVSSINESGKFIVSERTSPVSSFRTWFDSCLSRTFHWTRALAVANILSGQPDVQFPCPDPVVKPRPCWRDAAFFGAGGIPFQRGSAGSL